MTGSLGVWTKLVARVAAPIVVAAGLSACSSVPDWVDPTTWIGSDSQASDQGASGGQASDGQQTPDLASIPNPPTPPSTADEQKQVAESLEADRARAHYSADALRGGTEPAAAPPSPESPTDALSAPATDQSASSASGPSPEQGTDNAAAASGSAQAEAAATSAEPAAPAAAADQTAAATPAPASAPAADTQVAAAEPTNAPAAAPPGAAESMSTSSEQGDLGFQPSKAPPLDASVAKFVPQPILDRYQQTAEGGTMPAAATSSELATNPAPAAAEPSKGRARHKKHAPPADPAAAPADPAPATTNGLQPASFTPTPNVYADPAGHAPAAVVFFPHDTTVLGADARAQVHAAALAFKAAGGRGYVRIVGHSSSRTPDMPLAQHMEYNFERSQARATAVARELIRDGVPATKVLVEAVGDTQPVYYESMPKGEEGNRRAEIFLQS